MRNIGTRLKALAVAIALSLPYFAAFGVPQSYDRALGNVLVSEGYVYTNVPGDRGGPTNYGITIYDVRKFINPNATAQDVRNLTLAEAKAIYRAHYWDAVGGDSLPAGLDYSVFDYAVNAGPRRALGDLRACNWVGQPTPAAATLGPNPITVSVIKCVNDRRMAFQMGLPASQNKFKRGWSNRIKSVKNISLIMAGAKPAAAAGMIDLYAIPRIGIGKAYTEEPDGTF